jgi:hypothetical protein
MVMPDFELREVVCNFFVMMLRIITKKLGEGWQGFALHPKIQREALP